MRRRHLRGVMAIERQVYTRPWSPNLFLAEMTEPNNRRYLVARMDKDVVGYGGLDLLRRGGSRHQHRRRSVASSAQGGVAHALRADRERDRHSGAGGLARGPRLELGSAAALRALRLPPGGDPAELLPGAEPGRADQCGPTTYGPRRTRADSRRSPPTCRRASAPRDHPRHRDLVRRDRRRVGGGRVHRPREPNSRPRSICTSVSAGWSPRSLPGPTWRR